MAFTRATAQLAEKLTGKLTGLTESLTEKHHLSSRSVRTRVGLAGAAALTVTGVVGAAATPAIAAPEGGSGTYALGFVQAMAVGDTIADDVRAQAQAQQRVADAAEEKAEEAEKAAAEREAAEKREAEKAAAEKREAAEAERANERADRSAERRSATGYVDPVAGVDTTTTYKQAGASWSSGKHSGIDFPANTGTPVRSVGPGTVVTVGWGGAYGNQVVIRHDDGKYTQYAHLSATEVSAGQKVDGGQHIGAVGSTGNSTGPHLHFEARNGAHYGSDFNPITYLAGKGVDV
ncbi:M23 family metallopeptidase [Streptomyces verrucosisporus]|uniref:M23 family metallopeptidase n=1 Tax=Streptomyces verrucosisporus TaxID=1695161 RepID=UPI0019D2DE2D|nr:M23 family metallopeptidase [Streptomyces verrucosisporus]MBN3931935.1 M23 family metallopeptidase [Streptomyces verrucosisporus]